MASFDEIVSKMTAAIKGVREAVLGKDVREFIASGYESVLDAYKQLDGNVKHLKEDLTEFIDDHFEKPANYDYLTSKAPLDGVKGFNPSGRLNNFSGLNVFVTRVEENTEYKLSRTNNSISALNVPYARILFSTSNNAKAVGDTIDGIVAYSAEPNDKTFTVPDGAKYAYIGIEESRDVTNLSMQKITETHPSATYPIEKEKLINTECEFDLNENIEYARFRGQVEQQVLNNPYPFVNASDNAINKKLRSIIKDIRLIGFDKAEKYAVVIFRTRAGGASSFMMQMHPTDESGNSTGESVIHIDERVINIEQKSGIQQVTLKYGGGKRVCVSFDMEKYHSVSIFATTINYEIGGINPACYTVPDYGIKLSTSIPKDYPIVTIIDDDGSVGFMNTLQPVLDTYGFKATLAIVPSWIGASENYMTLDALKSVVASGHDVIAHSLTHDKDIWYAGGILTSNRSSRKSECEQSRDWFLDNGFGLVQAIAYPSGGYSTAQKRIIEDDVKPYFDYGFTTEPGVMTDNPLHALMLKRTAMNKASYDLDYYKGLIDECISSSGWLVLFCHSMSTSEVDTDFLNSIFAYLQETGVSVQRFLDAIKVKRNICSIGSWYREGSLYIGRDGTLRNAM